MLEGPKTFDRRPWITHRIPREWSLQIDTIATATEPFEDLFAEAMLRQDPDTIFAIQGLFCGSEHSTRAVATVVQLAERISADHAHAKERGKRNGMFKKELLASVERFTQLIEVHKRIPQTERPLLRLLMKEMSFLRYAQDIHARLEEGRTFEDIQHSINKHYPDGRLKIDLLNVLNWIRTSELHKALRQPGKTTPYPSSAYTEEYQPLYASYTWQGVFKLGMRHCEGVPFGGTIAMDPTRNAWVMGSGTYSSRPDVQTKANISYNGELTPQGCYFLPLRTMLRNDTLYAFIKDQTWRGIDSAIAQGLLKEYAPERNSDEAHTTLTPPNEETQHTPIETTLETITQNSPAVESAKSPELRKETRVPALLYRDYSRFFEACGARLVGGGTHLRFERDGKSISALNNDTGRVIESAEIMQKLRHLGIPEAVYIEHIPGSAGKELLARYRKSTF